MNGGHAEGVQHRGLEQAMRLFLRLLEHPKNQREEVRFPVVASATPSSKPVRLSVCRHGDSCVVARDL